MKKTQFKKGQSGNPQGRPKGTPNKTTSEVRLFIQSFLELQFDKLDEIFAELTAKEKVSALTRLLPYVVPKKMQMDLTATHENKITHDLSKLTDEELHKLEEVHKFLELTNKPKPEN